MTGAEALAEAQRRLQEAGLQEARRDARHLLAQVLEMSVERLFGHPDSPVTAAQATRLFELIDRRCKSEPLSRLLGRREFWSLSFELSPATLDPRPDSETIIEAALEALPERDRAWRILDLGTGSGCLIGALLSEYPKAVGTAVDLSAAAVETARDNLARLGFAARVRCLEADWDAGLEGKFDLIVANPPYITDAEIDGLAPAVADYDPRLALAGGKDGLDAYRALAPVLTRRLADEGVGVIEHGEGQQGAIGDLFSQGGLEVMAKRADLAGRPRCLVVRSA